MTYAEWSGDARRRLASGVPPGGETPLGLALAQPDQAVKSARVPRAFHDLAGTVALHRDPSKWDRLYELLWRLTHAEPYLLAIASDPLMARLGQMEKAVRRDVHKMHAFVRFRETRDGAFLAWYQPDHLIVEYATPFFARRFGAMRWSILTPDRCAYWDGERLAFGPGVARAAAPAADEIEPLWLTYYASIFNPARLNLEAMTAEMPVRHWSTLPEAALIQPLAMAAGARVTGMVANQPASARPFVPPQRDLAAIANALSRCEGCELYQHATQAVAGEGAPHARMLLVGEQPGDEEDRAGRPFVGPAGSVLDAALEAAGVPRAGLYVTNAVKHFRFEERGKRRIHQKPRASHVAACRPWLEAEVETVDPAVVVCLGGTAALSVLGREVRVLSERGAWQENRWNKRVLVTLHPAAIVRAQQAGGEQFEMLTADLRTAWAAAGQDKMPLTTTARSTPVNR